MNPLEDLLARQRLLHRVLSPNAQPGPEFALARRVLFALGFGHNVWGTPAGANADHWSGQFEEHVKLYQTARGLMVDGVIGPQTWGKLRRDAEAELARRNPTRATADLPASVEAQLRRAFIVHCEAELGVHDDRANGRKYRSPRGGPALSKAPNGVDKYQVHSKFVSKTGEPRGEMFCGSGLRYCLDMAARELGITGQLDISPLVSAIVSQGRARGRQVQASTVQAGDLICLWTSADGGKFYHVEVCTGPVVGGKVPTIGFNTSDGSTNAGGKVMRRSRSVSGGHVFIDPCRGVKAAQSS